MAAVTRMGSIRPAALALLLLGAAAGAGDDNRAPDLTGYEKLVVADGNKVAFAAYAEGVQIYRWDGTGWAFTGPEAILYSGDGDDAEVVGTHYAGPTWESNSGSKVVCAVLERATPDPTAVPWLKLGAVSNEGRGIFDRVTFVQRVYTTGGLAPAAPGDFEGEVARVPYSAWYYFYRERK
jgi:Protein of unknown function (DUF3455)